MEILEKSRSLLRRRLEKGRMSRVEEGNCIQRRHIEEEERIEEDVVAARAVGP